jgi:hypothetical protein
MQVQTADDEVAAAEAEAGGTAGEVEEEPAQYLAFGVEDEFIRSGVDETVWALLARAVPLPPRYGHHVAELLEDGRLADPASDPGVDPRDDDAWRECRQLFQRCVEEARARGFAVSAGRSEAVVRADPGPGLPCAGDVTRVLSARLQCGGVVDSGALVWKALSVSLG